LRHGGKKQGVTGERRHVGKHNRLLDQVCECYEALLVQRGNGHCFPGSANKISKVSRFPKRRQQVREFLVVVLFAVKFEVD
jgi:hypothetical protein